MAQTPSNMLALGTFAPEFYLKDTVSDKYVTYNDVIGGRGTLVMFICNHCPFVLHVIDEIVKIANEYKPQGIGIIAISSNDVVKYPQDVPELMTKFAQEHKFNFAYLYDETQEIAKVYDAACTPDFFLFDNVDKLIYRGQLDDSRPGNDIPVTGIDLRNAIESLINHKPINPEQKPSMGCGIKWKQ